MYVSSELNQVYSVFAVKADLSAAPPAKRAKRNSQIFVLGWPSHNQVKSCDRGLWV